MERPSGYNAESENKGVLEKLIAPLVNAIVGFLNKLTGKDKKKKQHG